MYKAFI